MTYEDAKKIIKPVQDKWLSLPNVSARVALESMTDIELMAFIALDSFAYGRPWDKAIENAKCHLKDKARYFDVKCGRDKEKNISIDN